jgi:DNA polymerase-3 subunit delta'
MSVWSALAGSRAIDALAAQVASSSVPHAWLLLGPRGAGKRLAAIAMAAALNCAVEPGVGCGDCSSCSRILRRRYPDVHHIAPEGPLIPVDVVRDVVTRASRSPFEGARKVFVIEEAERMNPAAQNALLKTLEEPEPDTFFVLVADNEDELLETIRSRCRTIRLEPLSEDQIVEALAHEGTSEPDARLAARLSGGDLERARELALDDAARARRAVWLSIPGRLASPVDCLDAAAEVIAQAQEVVRTRAETQKEEVIELAEALGEGRGTAAARNVLATRHKRELRRVEEDVLDEALEAIASFYRDALAFRGGGEADMLNADAVAMIKPLATSPVSDAALVAAIERCMEAEAGLAKNANQTLAIETTLLDLARLAPARPLQSTAGSPG